MWNEDILYKLWTQWMIFGMWESMSSLQCMNFHSWDLVSGWTPANTSRINWNVPKVNMAPKAANFSNRTVFGWVEGKFSYILWLDW